MAKFFHLPKSKRFGYQPRYYDEIKERREEREERIKKEVELEKQGKASRITKEDMTNYIKMTRRTQKKSNIRLVVILALLLMIFYFLFLK